MQQGSPTTMAGAFDPRRNSLAVLRLGLAGIVAVTHALANGYGHQPAIGRSNLGDLAVDGFFVLSGFLVTRSHLRLRSTRRYAWHRFLRIMPGFWMCLLVTAFVVAPLAALLAGRPVGDVLGAAQDPAHGYVLRNMALPIVQFGIGDLRTPTGVTALDGSLWTLAYEAACYVAIGLLGAVGLLRRRRAVAGLAAVAWVLLVLDHLGALPVDVPVFTNKDLSRFLLLFLLGALGHLYADRLPMTGRWAWVSAAVTVGSLLVLPDYRLLGAVAFAYTCLYAVVRLPVRATPRWDLSYGLYIYHWPVQFLLVTAGATALGQWPFVVVAVVLALAVSVLSWLLVESPALALKDASWVDARPVRR